MTFPPPPRAVAAVLDGTVAAAGAIGGVVLAAILVVVLADVAGRYFLNLPLDGALELVELGMLVLGAFSQAYTAGRDKHLTAELLTGRMSARWGASLARLFSLIGFVLWAVLAQRVADQAIKTWLNGEFTLTLHLLRGPFLALAAAALALFALILLRHAVWPPAPVARADSDLEDA